MVDLSTEYVGLSLANPLVPSASPLSRSLDDASRLEDAGAAAIVMYSLFEEELEAEEAMVDRFVVHQALGHGEALGFLPMHAGYRSRLDAYLEQLTALKSALGIPVIASLNGVSPDGWVLQGKHLERAGADALELNVYYIAGDADQPGPAVEARYLALLRELRKAVHLPIIMKLAPYFSSLPSFLHACRRQAPTAPRCSIAFISPTSTWTAWPWNTGSRCPPPPTRCCHALDRAAAREHDVVARRHERRAHWEDAAKMLLAGADVVHMASALLRHGPSRLTEVLEGLRRWMELKEYHPCNSSRAASARRTSAIPPCFARESYVRVLDSFTPPRGVWR